MSCVACRLVASAARMETDTLHQFTAARERVQNLTACVDRHVDDNSGKFVYQSHSQKSADEFMRCDMDVSEFAPSLSSDGEEVAFRLCGRTNSTECAITRRALEDHFWLPPNADSCRILKAFFDGNKRIAAIAERKSLIRPGQPIRLSSSDFATKA